MKPVQHLHRFHILLILRGCTYLSFFLLLFQASFSAPAPHLDNGCSTKVADVVFALDTSGSIWETDFVQQLEFVKAVVKEFSIGEDKVRIGLITFGTKVHHQFHLNKFFSKSSILKAIEQVKYVGGGTHTARAIAHARSIMFKKDNGGREGVAKILVVITDGFSHNTTEAAMEASLARSLGITIFSVGVGFGVDDFELKAIASKPKGGTSFQFRVDDFHGLSSIKTALATKACAGESKYYMNVHDRLKVVNHPLKCPKTMPSFTLCLLMPSADNFRKQFGPR